MLIDYSTARMSKNFVYLDAEMGDDDCSEDYDDEPFFQQSGLAYFKQMQELKQQLILADKQKSTEIQDEQEGAEEKLLKSAEAEDDQNQDE